jgi:hypothetical protein
MCVAAALPSVIGEPGSGFKVKAERRLLAVVARGGAYRLAFKV